MAGNLAKCGKGKFSGRGGHILCGRFKLLAKPSGFDLTTAEDFFFDGAQSPGWVLFQGTPLSSKNPNLQHVAAESERVLLYPETEFPFAEITGKHSFAIPFPRDNAHFNTLLLWCYKSDFLLGVGKIDWF